jgi:dipeptidyl aminopeptidase/acylaminoacyl peptidase
MPPVTAREGAPFFDDVEPARRVQGDVIDVHTPEDSGDEPRPAVVFVHGGPRPRDGQPRPRDSAVFLGYGALAAAQGLVGITFDHRLHTDADYPVAADDVTAAVERTLALDSVDPERVGLWFFSGGGPLAADWMRLAPSWLRCIAWNYPVLAPPPDWPGDTPRFDAITALTAAPALPTLLVRVGKEYPPLVPNQDAFVEAARIHHARLDVIDIPDADHGFEGVGYPEHARAAMRKAMGRVSAALRG